MKTFKQFFIDEYEIKGILSHFDSEEDRNAFFSDIFGIDEDELNEFEITKALRNPENMQTAKDALRGAVQGATWGAGENIIAGAKSLVKGTKYADELSKEKKEQQAAEKRSPTAYMAGQIAGGLATPIPGAAAAAGAIKGTSKLASIARGAVKGKTGNIAGDYAIGKGVDVVKNPHDEKTLAKPEVTKPIPSKPIAAVPSKPIQKNVMPAKLK